MYQGTTPSLLFNVLGYDLTSATVFVTFMRKKNELLTKTGDALSCAYDDVENYTSVICRLSQEETLAMKQGAAQVQIRFIYENGQAHATNKASIEIESVLYPEVIVFGGIV